MNIQEYDIMNEIAESGYENQRILTEKTGYSLGKVNQSLNELIQKEYLTKEYQLTEKAEAEFEKKAPKNAIILAAGYGIRMMPMNREVPKGLIEVNGEPLIERLIRQLHEAGIFQIDIIVGFMKEQYEYLQHLITECTEKENTADISPQSLMSKAFVDEKMLQIEEWKQQIEDGKLYLDTEEYEDYGEDYWDREWIIEYYDNQQIGDKIMFMIRFANDCINDRRYQEANSIYEWLWEMEVGTDY